MNILFCDDDLGALKNLYQLVTAFFEEKKIPIVYKLYSNGKSAATKNTPYDLAFIDIEMPGFDGSQVAKQLQKINPYVIIFMVTSFPNYLDDAMELKVFRYLTKPVERNRLYRNLNFALQQYTQQNQTILINTADGSQLIFTRDILFIGIHGRGTLIKTKSEDYQSRKTLSQWIEQLNADLFAQPHHSYLVNLQNVRSLGKEEVTLGDETNNLTTVIVSRRKHAEFKNRFISYAGGIK